MEQSRHWTDKCSLDINGTQRYDSAALCPSLVVPLYILYVKSGVWKK